MNELSAKEFLEIVNNELLAKLIELRDEAKLRCEDPEDEVSLGEFIGLRDAVERVQRFV